VGAQIIMDGMESGWSTGAFFTKNCRSVSGWGNLGRPVRYWNTPFVPSSALSSMVFKPRIIGYIMARRRSVTLK